MPTDKELLKNYWDAHAQFGPFDIGPEEHLRLCREAEGKGKTYMPTTEVDLTDHHPCPVCRRVLTDQPLCHYCAETDALRKDLLAANMRAVNNAVRLEVLIGIVRAAIESLDNGDIYTSRSRAAVDSLRDAIRIVQHEEDETA
jgi:hypothetical protein